MALVVESGFGLSDAESYISVADFKTYADARGLDYTGASDDTAIEQALRRATAWLDAAYGARFGGYRVVEDQALIFPRSGIIDRDGYGVASDNVPRQVVAATAQAAVREIAAPGSLSPDVTPGQIAKREKIGPIEVEYVAGTDAVGATTPVLQIVDGILSMLLSTKGRNPYFGTSVRA
jgi:hypothetical protein